MIRFGMIGNGRICDRIMDGFQYSDCAEISAVLGRTPGKVHEFADRYGIQNVYTELSEFLRSGKFDVVYIALPHTLHEPFAVRCMEAGFPVLCEKPLAHCAQSARRMAECALKNNVFLMEAMWTRMFPVTAQVQQWLPQLGKIRAVQGAFSFHAGEANVNDRLFDPARAGGALLDIGIYPLSYLSMILHEQPVSVCSLNTAGATGCDETSGIVLQYNNGCVASLLLSFCADLGDTLTIGGENGSIFLPPDFWRPKEASLRLTEHTKTVKDEQTAGEGFQHELRHVCTCLEKGLRQSPLMPLAESVAVLKTADRVRLCWQTGKTQ